MNVVDTRIADLKIIHPRRHTDERGTFMETYNRQRYAKYGIETEFVQDNYALSHKKGTIRGLHFQTPPCAQTKLVWVVRGGILDVVVDVRHGSRTYGEHLTFELYADTPQQVFVPIGFAHGYCTLEDETEVAYKVDYPYSPDHEGGVFWDDPTLGIAWPVTPNEAIVADRDRELPLLEHMEQKFSLPL